MSSKNYLIFSNTKLSASADIAKTGAIFILLTVLEMLNTKVLRILGI